MITLARSEEHVGDRVEADSVQAPHLLRLIAFANDLVQLLGDGLITYNSERYRQFTKMLSRLIRHTVGYVAESYAMLKINDRNSRRTLTDATHSRICVEFDVFVLRAAYFIYRSRCLGAWQYLAMLPFGDLSVETVWKLYYFLVAGGPSDVIEADSSDGKRPTTDCPTNTERIDSRYSLLSTQRSMEIEGTG